MPGCSFGWMVTAEESQTRQQLSAWKSSYLDHMALLQLEQTDSLPCFPPSTLTANVAFPGHSPPDLGGLNINQQDAVGGFLNLRPPYGNIRFPTGNQYLKDFPCALPRRLGATDKPVNASCAPQKRFLIFDQSGSHTRLFFSPSFAPRDQIFTSKIPPASANEQVASGVDEQFLMKPIVEEKWDENHLTDGEDEMLEDTEEINALLYSDSDDENDDNDDDDDGENDEVTSTGHSPFSIEEGCKDKSLEELKEELASSDESPKRRRLLDGKYKKSSLASAERLLKQATISCNYEDDVESSCAGEGNSHDDIDISSSCKRDKKVKIRQALKILESIIPGLTSSTDPLSIIDKAITHLKSMKTEAEALGLSYPGSEPTTGLP
ncbi:Transcription factor SAC51 [Sesamum alatum]|uniref:Transcription factor SAC51 n=1 Tax=Sesamum alatum TaxID=300844 RepID=A0AAE2CJK5_9LAMI|nr:Transcription factor SAC51 [Sesamum alatum]